MSTALAIAPDGTLCIDKTGPDDVIAAQAEILEGLGEISGLPGVVDRPTTGCLRLRHAGRHTLATWSAPCPRDHAAVVAALADTVDALHQAGIVHGSIRPDHVVIAGNGAPVLVGWSSARRVGDPSALSPAAAPAERRDDIEALGQLCVGAVAGRSTPLDGVARLLRTRRDDPSAELERMAEKIRAGRFDSARGVATGLRAAFGLEGSAGPTRAAPGAAREHPPSSSPRTPAAHAADRPRPTPTGRSKRVDRPRPTPTGRSKRVDRPRPTPTGRSKRVTPVLATSVLAVCGVVAAGFAAALGLGAVGGSPTRPTVVADAPADTTTLADPVRADPVDPVPAAIDGLECASPDAPDVDADGCGDAVTIEAGAVVVDGARYTVGAPDDELVVGDWDCDGSATLALVRGEIGEVWLFDRWPTDEPLTAELATVLPPPVAVTVVVSPADGCDRLVARGDGQVWSSADP